MLDKLIRSSSHTVAGKKQVAPITMSVWRKLKVLKHCFWLKGSKLFTDFCFLQGILEPNPVKSKGLSILTNSTNWNVFRSNDRIWSDMYITTQPYHQVW